MISEKLKKILIENGETYTVSGNSPFFIDDPTQAWFILKGKVDVFRVQKIDNEIQGARHHFESFDEEDLLLGIDADSIGLGLSFLAVGTVNTKVVKIPLEKIVEFSYKKEFLSDFTILIDTWVNGLSEGVTRPVFPKPRADLLLTSPEPLKLEETKRLKTHKEIYWIKDSKVTGLFTGMEEIEINKDSNPLPLSPFTWFETLGEAELNFFKTKDIIEGKNLWDALDSFYDTLLYCELMNSSMIKADELGRMNLKAELQSSKEKEAHTELSKIIDDHEIVSEQISDESDPLFKAMAIVAEEIGVDLEKPDDETKKISKDSPVKLIAEASGLRIRNVKLEGNWWNVDSGNLLAVTKDGSPVALVRNKNKYIATNTKEDTEFIVDQENVEQLSVTAVMFYKGFDDSRAITLKDIFKFGFNDIVWDLAKILVVASIAALLGLLVPVFTGIVYDSVIPSHNKLNLGFLVAILISTSIVTAIFKILQSIVNIRVESKLDYQLEAAVWDRILTLPVKFFNKFNSGDLAKRVKGIQEIRQTVTSVTLTSLFDITFAVFNFALLFYYSSILAFWAAIPIIAAVVLIFYLGYRQIKLRRHIQKLEQFIQGFLLQIISGISKLRASATETSAFAEWAKKFTLLRKYQFKSRLLVNYQEIFFAGFPVFTSIIFFYVVISSIESASLTTGEFIAFNTAFTAFLVSVISISQKVIQLLNLEAVYVNAKPILEEIPEDTEAKPKARELSGLIEFKHITFRYNEESPYILRNLSMTINPGEFVAVVGPSGSGKSTLLRVLMGFEQPEQGSVFYDSYDMTKVDIKSIRRQVGVVLQNGKLLTGTILQNIIGSSNLTIDHAWKAARAAGLDKDIEEMPMGMFTIVSENASTLSGGQRQRLMIARSIVRKPKIIMMDEATSALDNRTQEIVSKSLEQLQATRIVIAHRLSTIINADRIIVLRNGVIEQDGTYNQLVEQEGLFKELALRQIA